MLANKVYKKEVMKNNVKLTIISTPILILDETKRRYLKELVKEFKIAEKANKIHTYAKISMEISYNDTVELHRVTQLKVTKKNLKVTIQFVDGDNENVEYTTLNFPIGIIKSIEARVI